jgi:hypothetical protein
VPELLEVEESIVTGNEVCDLLDVTYDYLSGFIHGVDGHQRCSTSTSMDYGWGHDDGLAVRESLQLAKLK